MGQGGCRVSRKAPRIGSLAIPASGTICVDAQAIIYSVEHHPKYYPLMAPLWVAAELGTASVATSEMSILECFVKPLRLSDPALIKDYDDFFALPELRLVPIATTILREAAHLRAKIQKLKPPDAIHAATAFSERCVLFITNDTGFRAVPGLPVIILDDLLAVP